MSAKILIVDDEQSMCELVATGLSRIGFETRWETSAAAALALVPLDEFHAVVTDLNMARMGGVEFCRRAIELRPGLPVVVLTAFGSMDSAVAAIRAGAYDFINKPVDMEVLGLAVQRAVRSYELQNEVARLRNQVDLRADFDELVGSGPAMKKLYALLSRVADSDASLLITGETGTGKELVARAVHKRSRRAKGKFVAVNCAAIPAQLLESEFFGHVRGAFTDARTSRAGLFEQAEGGTVFLDEIGELPIELQPKLLRALQERSVRPLGSSSEIRFDVRLMTATNRDLEAAVDAGSFREDLLYRINVIQADVPPLRVRGNDILSLAQRFIRTFAERTRRAVGGLSTPTAKLLLAYGWPGNVRELENTMERAVTLAEHDQIVVDDLPDRIRTHRPSKFVISADDSADFVTVHEIERRYILRVLAAFGGNKRQAARTLGLDRKTLWRKLKQYGVADSD